MKTPSRRLQHISLKENSSCCRSLTFSQEVLWRQIPTDSSWLQFLGNLWSWYEFPKKEVNCFNMQKLPMLYFRTFYAILFDDCFNILLLKLDIRKHIAVSVNKESVSKNFSEKLLTFHTLQYPAFYKTFYWLLSKILETEFLKKKKNDCYWFICSSLWSKL